MWLLQAACAEAEAGAANAGRGSVLEEVRDATRSLHSVLAGQRAREVTLALQERNVPEDKWWGALIRVTQGEHSPVSLHSDCACCPHRTVLYSNGLYSTALNCPVLYWEICIGCCKGNLPWL